MRLPLFSPSLMCMDLLDIKDQLRTLDPLCDMYHVDIMDGHFVKNITLSPDFVKAISPVVSKPIDCHLMVEYPDDYIEVLIKNGAEYISLHAETINKDAFRLINKIKRMGAKVGVVLNPATPLSYISQYIGLIDKLTVMTVDPGFAGQPFIRQMLEKIEQARDIREKSGYSYLIEVDGSCNEKTFGELYKAGTEVFIVGGSGLFSKSDDLNDAWNIMLGEFSSCTGVGFNRKG